MEEKEFQNELKDISGRISVSGRIRMLIPQVGSEHVRAGRIILPFLTNDPIVTVTIHSPQSQGPSFAVYQLLKGEINVNGKIVTLISVWASETRGVAVNYNYFCDYIVVATPN